MKSFAKTESIVCPYCGGKSEHDAIDYVPRYPSATGTPIFRSTVDEQICENCGEGYLTRFVNDKIYVDSNWSEARLYAVKCDGHR